MYIYLDFVEQFACRMCGTCCRNQWMITVDEQSYYRNFQMFAITARAEEFAKAFIAIENKANPGEFAYIAKKQDGSCWFLEDCNLCRLQQENGHDHLDTVCQTYPRYPMNTARGIELTLSLSCPAALNLVCRAEPLKLIRSEHAPLVLANNNYVTQVFPRQQSHKSPLRHYFELEQHFIDIMQARVMTITERLRLIQATVCQLESVTDDDMGRKLNGIFNENYCLLDSMDSCNDRVGSAADIIIENFFVNFIFKKPLYAYGLGRAMSFMYSFWDCISSKYNSISHEADRILTVKETIIALEIQYGHNRRAWIDSQKGL